MKTPRVNSLKALYFLVLIAVCAAFASSACSFGSATAQRPPSKESETADAYPTPSPTPGYKPAKRVSRDVLDSDKRTDKKDEAEKSKTKK